MARVLIHCPAAVGHHGTYVRFLLQHWVGLARRPFELGLLLPRDFAEWFPDVVSLARDNNVTLHTSLLPTVTPGVLGGVWSTQRAFREITRTIEEFGAERCLLLYADPFVQLILPLHLRSGAALSGILFRSTVHYASFGVPLTLSEQLRSARHAAALLRATRHPELECLFWLDPFGAEHARRSDPEFAHKQAWLPDPLDTVEAPRGARLSRSDLPFDARKKVLLLFGPPGARKGTAETLAALCQVPLQQQQDLAVLVVGAISETQRREFGELVAATARNFAGTLWVADEFVTEAQTLDCFNVADVILAPYQRHVGSSGILLRAAQAGKPVVASDFGLLGEWTRRHRLGVTVDSRSKEQLAWALTLAAGSGLQEYFDPQSAAAFAGQFSKLAFAEALLGVASKA